MSGFSPRIPINYYSGALSATDPIRSGEDVMVRETKDRGDRRNKGSTVWWSRQCSKAAIKRYGHGAGLEIGWRGVPTRTFVSRTAELPKVIPAPFPDARALPYG